MGKIFIVSVQKGITLEHVTIGVNTEKEPLNWKYFDKQVYSENYPLCDLIRDAFTFFTTAGLKEDDVILCPECSKKEVEDFILDLMMSDGEIEYLYNITTRPIPDHHEIWGAARKVGELCAIIGKRQCSNAVA